MFLKQEFGTGTLVQDGDYAHAVDGAVFGARLALRGFPGSFDAVRVQVDCFDEAGPAGFCRVLLRFINLGSVPVLVVGSGELVGVPAVLRRGTSILRSLASTL